MAGPWEKYGSQQGGVFNLPPDEQTLRSNDRQDRNDARSAGNDAQRIEMERQRVLLAQQQAQQEAAARQQQQQAEALKLEAARKEAEQKSPYNPQQIDSIKTDAMNKLHTIDRIGQNYDTAWAPAVGFGAETMSDVGGTNAHNIRTALGELKAGGALSEVMKMSQATGKNPLSPMSNSDVDLVSSNIAGVDQGQAPREFFKAIQPYRNAYTKAYAGAVGAETLNSETARQLEKYRRENPNRTPAQDTRFQSVLQAQAPQLYEQRMRSGLKPPPRKQQQSSAKFLGWED